jgi:hypothetical protein
METLWQDRCYALRSLLKKPGFAAVVMLLGIGANAAIFSLIYGILLRHFPCLWPSQVSACARFAVSGA